MLLFGLLTLTSCHFVDEQKSNFHAADCRSVVADLETEPVSIEGDVLDDVAIWVHPTDRSKSQILVTNKKGGLHVYGLDGQMLQFIPAGRLNNVDIRYGFPFAGGTFDLAVASNRSFNTLSVFANDPATGFWKEVSARAIKSSLSEVYGLCMYRSMRSGKFYAIVNSKDGQVEQWELFCRNDSLVDAALVRQFSVKGQVEGCVADDETGYLYIAEEQFGIWKYYAEPVAPDRKIVADTNSMLSPQIEGLALYKGQKGTGYLIAVLQHNNQFAVFERKGTNRYVGCFSISDGPNTNAVMHTDGLEVVEVSLGEQFPRGLLAVHDGYNTINEQRVGQNVKLVDWGAIAACFEKPLLVDTVFYYHRLAYPTPADSCR